MIKMDGADFKGKIPLIFLSANDMNIRVNTLGASLSLPNLLHKKRQTNTNGGVR